MEKYIPCKWEAKKAGVVILISDKIDLKIKKITRDKEGHYTMIKGSIQEEDITIVNIYAPNRASLVAQRLKCLPGMQETPVRLLGQEDLLEKG